MRNLCISSVLYQIDPLVYSTHLSMMYRAGRNLKDWNIVFTGRWRMAIDEARNFAADVALQSECEYLFFYDDDMLLHSDVLERLVNRMETTDADIVMAKTWVRGHPFNPMCFRFINKEKTGLSIYDYKKEDILENGLVKVDAVGAACTIMKVELFKNMSRPWFFTGQNNTEDVYFCLKAREVYENVNIYVDDTFSCGHLFDKRVITEESRQNLIDDFLRGYNSFGLPIPKQINPKTALIENKLPFD